MSDEPTPRRPLDEEQGGEHLDADTAADLAAGLLEPEQERRWQAHVSGCAACQDLLARLAAVSAALAGWAAEPLPADVAARVDAALDEVDPVPAPRVVHLAPVRRQPPRGLGPLLALAASLVLVVGGLSWAVRSGGSSSRSDSGSSAAGAATGALASAAPAGGGAGGGSSTAAGASAASSVASSAGADAAAPVAPAASGAARSSAGRQSASGTAYPSEAAALARTARHLLDRSEESSGPSPSGGGSDDASCLPALGRPAPELVDRGTYAGRPALLVVQRLGDGRLRLSVLAADCGAAPRLLLRRVVP
ncbi:hypothetical protein EV189_0451 [Motilibacter rhizosphaerae]|uniref:Uncharacterized protein n=1 Tax=Motilibacter rhizosphaerae TaxID=598652 RepID=A0A4Q7NVK2_9ACTN|nr:hypothetical protein [Motilibacter rhizosphaerae]RZS91217.1 hypothetical protein EV189_0451 [Motilibacter rhizosphaerae]